MGEPNTCEPKLRDIDTLIARLKQRCAEEGSEDNRGDNYEDSRNDVVTLDKVERESSKERAKTVESDKTVVEPKETPKMLNDTDNAKTSLRECKVKVLGGLKDFYSSMDYLYEQGSYWSENVTVGMDIPLYKEKIMKYFMSSAELLHGKGVKEISNILGVDVGMVNCINTGEYGLKDICDTAIVNKEQKNALMAILSGGNVEEVRNALGDVGNIGNVMNALAKERRIRHSFRRALQLVICDVEEELDEYLYTLGEC